MSKSIATSKRHKHLPTYCRDLRNTNPNSVIILNDTEDHKLSHVFICYDAKRFTHLPSFAQSGWYAPHSKTTRLLSDTYVGILLAAIVVHANGSLFPVAFAVVIRSCPRDINGILSYSDCNYCSYRIAKG